MDLLARSIQVRRRCCGTQSCSEADRECACAVSHDKRHHSCCGVVSGSSRRCLNGELARMMLRSYRSKLLYTMIEVSTQARGSSFKMVTSRVSLRPFACDVAG